MSSIILVSPGGSSIIMSPIYKPDVLSVLRQVPDSECDFNCDNPATNGLAEPFNKTIIKLLKKFIPSSKRDWNKKLSECLWAYQMMVRLPTSNTPFSLVYDCEVVIPLEIQIPSLCVALATKMTERDNDRLHLQELEALDEKRLQAQQRIELCQARISKAFNKKVQERVFQTGDLVLAIR